MESIQNTREGDLERVEILLQQAKPNVELQVFDESTVGILEEAMRLVEKWEAKEKMVEVYTYWGIYHLYKGNQKIALDFFLKSKMLSLQKYEKTDEKIADLDKYIGEAYTGLYDFANAEKYLGDALATYLALYGEQHKSVVECYNKFGTIRFYQRKLKKSIDYQKKGLSIALQLPEDLSELIAELHCNLASSFVSLGEYSVAKEHLKNGMEILKALFPSTHKSFLGVYPLLAHVCKKEGDFHKGLLYLQKCIHCFEYNQLNGINLAYVYNEMANVHFEMKNDTSQLIEYLEKALAIMLEHNLEAHELTVNIYINLGATYTGHNNWFKAKSYLEKALEIGIQLYGEEEALIARVYKFLGAYHCAVKEFDKALEHYQKATTILEKNKNSRIIDFASTFREEGNVYMENKKYENALKKYLKSFNYILGIPESENIYELLSFKSHLKSHEIPVRHIFFIGLILDIGLSCFNYYRSNTKELKTLKAALDYYQIALDYGDEIRQSYQMENAKLLIGKDIEKSLQEGMEVLNVLFEETQDAAYLQKQFLFSEKGKAYLMLQNTQEKTVQQKNQLSTELLRLEQDLKVRLALLEKNIQVELLKKDESDTSQLQEFQDTYFHVSNEFEAFKEQLETDYPEYYRQKYSTKTVAIEALQSTLEENQAVLSYFIGEEKIYLFTVTSNEYEVFSLEKPDNLEGLIQNYLQSIKLHQKAQFHQLSFELYQILLQEAMHHIIDPFEEEVKQVFIIPHAELHYLPFETLIIQEADVSKSYQELGYLLNHCEISYHYSATLLHLDLQKQAIAERAPAEMTFTGFAPVYDSSSEGQKQALQNLQNEYATAVNRSEAVRGDGTWMPLPYSKIEVENISQLFEKQGFKSQSFLHEMANKNNLEEQIGNSRFVLIAAHGIVNDEFPELSGLVLAEERVNDGRQTADGVDNSPSFEKHGDIRNGGDEERNLEEISIENCILNMKEVAMIPMNADLVVLSSCESGIGELHKGEGMMAVNRGFLASGAKNVVSTLFKVNDLASSELTQLLFAHILKGESYSTALQKAKLALLKREGMSPKSWSGFVLFGKGS
ncbi:MAG: CHAT domain-containing protein [Chitinophagales bacterium]